MSIDPQFLAFLDQLPQLDLTREHLARTRAELNRMSKQATGLIKGFDHIDVRDEFIAGPDGGGSEELRLRLYSRPGGSGARPGLLWVHFAWDCYLGVNDPSRSVSPFASPARAEELEGLPPAYLCIGEEDLFHEESLEYARRLRDSGVAVDLEVVPGAPHAFDKLPAPISERSLRRRLAALARHFAQHG